MLQSGYISKLSMFQCVLLPKSLSGIPKSGGGWTAKEEAPIGAKVK